MSKEDVIEVEACVIEVLPSRVARVELANGYRLLAHPPAWMRKDFAPLSPGERVRVAVSPYDLSKGAIIERQSEVKL